MANDPAVGAADWHERLTKVAGVNLCGYKASTLERRLQLRRDALRLGPDEYLAYVRAHPKEVSELRRMMLIPVTSFFRDPAAWEFLRMHALPGLLAGLASSESLRVWCAGCSSGEEVYSVAICVAELLGERRAEFEVKIYGTDLDDAALTCARRGIYAAAHLRRVTKLWRDRYFEPMENGRFRVRQELRHWAIFGRGDVTRSPPIAHAHLIVCRNLLIYFDPAAQRQIVDRMHFGLEPGGLLFLGRAESLANRGAQFRALSARWRVFARCRENPAKVSTRRPPAVTSRGEWSVPASPVEPHADPMLQLANEEMQSANEELETMNEQLQATNEDLTASNEELQLLNAKLVVANQGLEQRQAELDRMQQQYFETLERMPWPVMLVDEQARIRYWNAHAYRLFGFRSNPSVGLHLEQLPTDEGTRRLLLRRHRLVARKGRPSRLRRPGDIVHFAPLEGTAVAGLRHTLVIFEPRPTAPR